MRPNNNRPFSTTNLRPHWLLFGRLVLYTYRNTMGASNSSPTKQEPKQPKKVQPEKAQPKMAQPEKDPNPTIVDIPWTDSMSPVLIITDLHLGKHGDKQRAFQCFKSAITETIQTVHPGSIFCLGDIIHRNETNTVQDLINFFQMLKELTVLPCHIILGNHDRKFTKSLAWRNDSNVYFHPEAIMNINNKVFLTHDMLYCRVGRSLSDCRAWFSKLRGRFPGKIPDDALLICGHIHTQLMLDNGMTRSVATYSPEDTATNYAILTLKNDGNFEFQQKTKFLKDVP
ncbi:Ser/Thr protein phosphatase [Histomonas meleagridis]|uniref:Ser/Thr protein phosphatase n=1 Tax=Histomonas meleagridis TaxID=135588 RepID=UPI00355A2D55|nr:Ser/Thr protein phosphatase [Histomonas meleagridis]KAH0804686.1 Ser/Thr protein phosphatase [Histomonas meleagridis]